MISLRYFHIVQDVSIIRLLSLFCLSVAILWLGSTHHGIKNAIDDGLYGRKMRPTKYLTPNNAKGAATDQRDWHPHLVMSRTRNCCSEGVAA